MPGANLITQKRLHDLLPGKSRLRVIDVRSATEFNERHIPDAEHVPIDRIESGVFTAADGEIIVTACGSGGGRSERAAKMLSEKLNNEVYYLEGGTFGWYKYQAEVLPEKETLLKRFLRLGHLPSDSQEEKVKKSILLLMAIPFALSGIAWGCLYLYYDRYLPAVIPLGYAALSFLSIAHFIIWKTFRFFRFSQILLILLLPFFLQLSLGGFVSSSVVILWSIISPLGALAFYDIRRSIYWFFAFAFVVTAAFVLEDLLPAHLKNELPPRVVSLFFFMNVLGASGLIYIMQYYFASRQKELKEAVEKQNTEIAEKSREIMDSINYAKRIQITLLAKNDLLNDNLGEHFVLYKPKDIVSGDFYWATRRGSKFYLAVCDSTGHGVPGAFMSLMNISFLNEAINEKGIEWPHAICNYVREKLIMNLSDGDAKDGMDGVLICWDTVARQMTYAAAHNRPFLVSKGGQGQELEGDKMPIGKGELGTGFREFEISLSAGDTLYLFTDGFADQFGGPKGKKFKSRRFHELLASMGDVPMDEQKKVLDALITEWKGKLEQTDDILVVGVKV